MLNRIAPLAMGLCLCPLFLHAAVFYVSPSGNDGNPGTLSRPFQNLQAAVTHLSPGDTLRVREGTYHGQVRMASSGASGSPLTLEAYPGETPLLDGADPVTGTWTSDRGSIYRAPWPAQPLQVFCDGRLLNEARWPAADVEGLSRQSVARADSGSATQITCSNLPAVDLTGALLQIMPGQSWCSYTRTVASHNRSTGALAFDQPVNEMAPLVPRRGDRFYLFGKLNLLTAPGEWYWDPSARALYVWAPDGASPAGRVEAGEADWVLSLDDQSFVMVKGLAARGGWFSLHGSSHCTVEGCALTAPNWTRLMNGYASQPGHRGGIDVAGTGNRCLRDRVVFAGRSGVNIQGGASNEVQQATVEDCGWNWGNDGGIEMDATDQCLLRRCTIRRVARAGIFDYGSTRCRILSNLVEKVALYSEDMGNFDTWGTDGKDTEIAYNLMRDNQSMWGAGIYLDDNAKGFNVHDNRVEDTAWFGLIFKDLDTLKNNTVLSAGHQAIYCYPPPSKDLTGAVVAHNRVLERFPLRVSLNQAAITDYGYYGGYADLDPGPRRVEIDWTRLDQPWWSAQVPLELTRINAISFSVDCLADPFTFTIANLRLLPQGRTGDAGAVTITGSWWSTAGQGSACALSASGPVTWGAAGKSVLGGWNTTGVSLPPGLADLGPYRGLAFEIGGKAVRDYRLNGCKDQDNGPEAKPGRGAVLPVAVGADTLKASD